MSKMLKALRQLEATERLAAAPSPPEEAAASEPAEDESQPRSSTPPIEPASESPLPHDEPFEPGFTAYGGLSEPYDTVDALTFDGFLEEADAKRSTDALPAGAAIADSPESPPHDDGRLASPEEALPLAEDMAPSTEDIQDVEANMLSTLESAEELVADADDQLFYDEALSDELSSPLLSVDLQQTESTSEESSVDDALDASLEDHAIEAAAEVATVEEEMVRDEPLGEVAVDKDAVDAEAFDEEAALGETAQIESLVDDELATTPSEPMSPDEHLIEGLAPDVEAEVELDTLPEPPEEFVESSDSSATDSAEYAPAIIDDSTENLVAATESPDESFAIDSIATDECADNAESEQETEFDPELSEMAVEDPTDEGLPQTDDKAASAADSEIVDDEHSGDSADDTLGEPDDLNWDELFPAADDESPNVTDDETDLATNDALGEIDVDELTVDTHAELDEDLGDAILGAPADVMPMMPGNDVFADDQTPAQATVFDEATLDEEIVEGTEERESEAPATEENDTATGDESAIATSDELGDIEPITEEGDDIDVNGIASINAASEQPSSNDVEAEDRPAFSAAEVAASADLLDAALREQFQVFVDRIDQDLGSGEHRCVALVGAEHQPHVTDAILRTAMAACLDEGRHVLLIDASLDDKHLTAGLGLSPELGLSEVIKGRVPWQQAVRATGTPGMCVLPAGRITPPDLSPGDDRLSDLLKELTCQWDLVLLDAGCCQDSWAGCTMTAARNVYLLIRLGETQIDAARQAIDAIAASGAKHRGAIATNA